MKMEGSGEGLILGGGPSPRFLLPDALWAIIAGEGVKAKIRPSPQNVLIAEISLADEDTPDIVLRSVRTGKMMMYDPETGHRIKDENQPNRINWVHSVMKAGGTLPADWQLTQCLFGEHLLRQYPNKVVALVESEKTACICAGLMPRFLWLATGGKSQINDRLLVLKGRKVVAFPDIDGYDEWQRKLAEYPELGISISPVLQQNATKEDREAHIDIADWLLRYMFGPPPEEVDKWHQEFLKAAEFISPEHHAEVEALIHDLGLEFWRAGKVEPPPEEASTDTVPDKKPS